MNRFVCFFLAICIVLCTLPGVSFPASAEEAFKLHNAALDFELPIAGNRLPDTFTVMEGFVIDRFTWEIYQDGAWHVISEQEEIYSDNQIYKLHVYLVCSEGFYIDFENHPVGYIPGSINGDAVQATFFGDKDAQKNNQWKGVVMETVVFGSAVPVIKTIDVSGIPTQTGDFFTAQQIDFGDARLSAGSCHINVDGEEVESLQFGYGYYNIHIDITADEGYVLDPDTITVNGVPIRECGWEVSYGFDVGYGWISLSCKHEPESYVDSVTVSGVPNTIVADAPISAPQLSVKWSSNGSVTVAQSQWLDETYVPAGGNFEAGKVYYLAITLQTQSDTPFRDFFNLELLDETESFYSAALATAGNATTAVAYIRYALLPTLDQLQILLNTPAVGDMPGEPSVDDQALFTIDSYQWVDLDEQDHVTVFEDGHRYRLEIRISPVEGYQFQVGAGIFVNGVAVQAVTDPDGQSISVEFSFLKYVERVEVLTDTPFDSSVAGVPVLGSDSAVSITAHRWTNAKTGSIVESFVPGARYYLDIEIQVADGYAFANQFSFMVNGQSVKAVLIGNRASVRISFDLVQTLTEVSLEGVPDSIVAGQVADIPNISASNLCTGIADVHWLDEDMESFHGSFEAGNIYYLAITMQADSLWEFAQSVKVLGNEEVLAVAFSDNRVTAVAYIRYSLLTKVEMAQITVATPKAGETPAAPAIDVNMPYSIVSFSWKDMLGNTEFSVFEEGHSYALTVELCPNDGAEFVDLVIMLNGELIDLSDANNDYAAFTVEFSFRGIIDRIDLFAPELIAGREVHPSQIVVLTDGVTLQSAYWINAITFEKLNGQVDKALYALRASVCLEDGHEFAPDMKIYLNGQCLTDVTVRGNIASCAVSYDLRELIGEVKISGMPQISIGGSTESITMTVPDGAPYSVQANWLLYGGDYQFSGPGANFEDGKVYYLEILVKPAAGYRIADDAAILVDGGEFSGITMTDDSGIWLYKQYNCGLQVIERIDLIVEQPVAGKLSGAVKLPEGSCVSLRDFVWAYSETGKFADAVDLLEGDVFEAGYYYMICGSLVADKGYVFAENLTITVNGVPTNIDLRDLGVINLGDTAFLGHSFGLLQQVQQPAPTGDSIGLVVALLFASAAACLMLRRKK